MGKRRYAAPRERLAPHSRNRNKSRSRSKQRTQLSVHSRSRSRGRSRSNSRKSWKADERSNRTVRNLSPHSYQKKHWEYHETSTRGPHRGQHSSYSPNTRRSKSSDRGSSQRFTKGRFDEKNKPYSGPHIHQSSSRFHDNVHRRENRPSSQYYSKRSHSSHERYHSHSPNYDQRKSELSSDRFDTRPHGHHYDSKYSSFIKEGSEYPYPSRSQRDNQNQRRHSPSPDRAWVDRRKSSLGHFQSGRHKGEEKPFSSEMYQKRKTDNDVHFSSYGRDEPTSKNDSDYTRRYDSAPYYENSRNQGPNSNFYSKKNFWPPNRPQPPKFK